MDKLTELDRLKQQLRDMRSMHMSMWNEYGSELCAGDMSRQEQELQDKIDALSSNSRKPGR